MSQPGPLPAAGGAGCLSTSLVTFRADRALLQRTLAAYAAATAPLLASGWRCQLTVVDNASGPDDRAALQSLLPPTATLLANSGNRGFGRAHNQVIAAAASDFHLILNPDLEMAPDALTEGLRYLQQHVAVVAVSPSCRNGAGQPESLCKRLPSVLDLALRGFAPQALQRRCAARLARYACADLLAANAPVAVPLASGCWLLCRTAALQAVGGFDPRYFLYFEDFALSLALQRQGALHHVPACRVLHHGGQAARKGWRHRWLFARSATQFLARHGWRWA